MSLLLAQTDAPVSPATGSTMSALLDLIGSYSHIFLVAFVVTLAATPLIRRLAIGIDAVDHPDFARKAHARPVAYMGGVAVFVGLIIALATSYITLTHAPANYLSVPIAIIIGLVAITFTGLADDLWGWDPRLKVAGQLVAAAALAIEEVGVKVAAGIVMPVARFWIDESLNSADLVFQIPMPGGQSVSFDLIYWIGTAIIAVFVLGGCNAANLVDGLDGLLSGVTAIVALGLLVITLLMAVVLDPQLLTLDQDSLAGARIVLCLAVLGAVLGFLPYNFNPASIFLGDCGSLLLGYCSVVIILMLGDEGMTHLVVCGLIVFSIPIIDTLLAIIRRTLAGVSLSGADDQHIHHRLLRRLGTVRKTVVMLYVMGFGFAVLGAGLAALVTLTDWRARLIYVVAAIFYAVVLVTAFAMARRGPAVPQKATD